MAQITTWTWYVSSMYTIPVPNEPEFVTTVTWRLIGTDGQFTADVGNNAQFEIKESDPNFIPYANLTEEIVLGWVQEQLGPEGIQYYQAKAQASIDDQANPPLQPAYTPLPWAQQGESNV